jgi:hypothetical protein
MLRLSRNILRISRGYRLNSTGGSYPKLVGFPQLLSLTNSSSLSLSLSPYIYIYIYLKTRIEY